ncbi:D-2-hydroxyacid dehydrogenase [Pseudoalteromonas mariniglutinosa]|uniref:D-2-hydroxyacid dehydrogenase n=1 Tax=Pseudoalteromonas mariniglutinosa TaxID=206042 RepID=UPI003850D673
MNITLLDAATLADTPLDTLQQIGSLTCYALTNTEDRVKHCQGAEVIITNKVVIDAHLMAQLTDLKLICVAATGTNNIDLQAAKKHNIAVTNVAGYSTPAVVQHTFALITNLLGNTHRYIRDCQQGQWQQSPMFCRLDYSISEISGKTLAIIGYGSLGKAVAEVARAFGAKVIISERKGLTPRADRYDFAEVIRSADIISVHCPLNEETRDLIAAAELAMMKPSAIIINTARGGIINEADLSDALTRQQIAGAGIDVLSQEPAQPSNPLACYKGDNLLLTPHIAWASKESIARLVNEIALNINAFKQNKIRNRLV